MTPGFGFVRLRELNLRTYVRFRGQQDLFFTLDTDNLLGQWIGRKFFVTYRLQAPAAIMRNKDYLFKSADSLQLRAQIGVMLCVRISLDRWLVGRYSYLLVARMRFFVVMCCTSSSSVEVERILMYLSHCRRSSDLTPTSDCFCRYAEVLDVRFRPFTKLL